MSIKNTYEMDQYLTMLGRSMKISYHFVCLLCPAMAGREAAAATHSHVLLSWLPLVVSRRLKAGEKTRESAAVNLE